MPYIGPEQPLHSIEFNSKFFLITNSGNLKYNEQ